VLAYLLLKVRNAVFWVSRLHLDCRIFTPVSASIVYFCRDKMRLKIFFVKNSALEQRRHEWNSNFRSFEFKFIHLMASLVAI
jgi:hypothetical protein